MDRYNLDFMNFLSNLRFDSGADRLFIFNPYQYFIFRFDYFYHLLLDIEDIDLDYFRGDFFDFWFDKTLMNDMQYYYFDFLVDFNEDFNDLYEDFP